MASSMLARWRAHDGAQQHARVLLGAAMVCGLCVNVTHQLTPCAQDPAARGQGRGALVPPARFARARVVRLRGGLGAEVSEDDGDSVSNSAAAASVRGGAGPGAGAGLVQEVPERIDFPRMEEQILDYWDEVGALELSEARARAENRTPWIFFDGPPFATGMPHYGHILAGTIKDVVTRFWSQNGRLVERKWGWDCHGLPIEHEIEQTLGIKSRDDVLAMGIPAFNAECRRVVMRYAGEWKRVVRRLARWIDMDKGYKTLDTSYMESVWWTCQQLHKKKLLYRGFKVMPYSTGCMTALSNFEANLNYQDVSDPAIIVRFPLLDDPDLNLLVWTTTPWTIPSNLAVCVNADAEYVEARDVKSGARFVVMRQRLVQVYGKHVDKACEILSAFPGSALVGRQYSPPFDFFAEYAARGGFRVVADAYVSADSGTGLVHMAPGFGEDDLRVCLREGIVAKLQNEAAFCAVDAEGCFTSRVPPLQGVRVKDADSSVIGLLKDLGRLEQHASLVHSYPFCYRSETPLIYKAVPSWFVDVESIKERLVCHNQATRWVPAFVKEKRFHNWLASARDWAISRDRYWGTPIPIWHSEDWEEVVCVGSIQELCELSGVRVSDLHRESIDHITIPSQRPGGAPLKRVGEVFDCWFESGAMPMAQHHYPFQKPAAEQEGLLQADFIAEGLDQTRGWFYTLMVLSTALFDRPAFKNVMVNGLVLAADGKKMSKRLRNYPDPQIVINATGADALRLYLISSPAVRAEPLRFKEEDVRGYLYFLHGTHPDRRFAVATPHRTFVVIRAVVIRAPHAPGAALLYQLCQESVGPRVRRKAPPHTPQGLTPYTARPLLIHVRLPHVSVCRRARAHTHTHTHARTHTHTHTYTHTHTHTHTHTQGGTGGDAAMVQCLSLPGPVLPPPGGRLAFDPAFCPPSWPVGRIRKHHGRVDPRACSRASARGAAGDGGVQPLLCAADADENARRLDQLVCAHEPRAPQGGARRTGS